MNDETAFSVEAVISAAKSRRKSTIEHWALAAGKRHRALLSWQLCVLQATEQPACHKISLLLSVGAMNTMVI